MLHHATWWMLKDEGAWRRNAAEPFCNTHATSVILESQLLSSLDGNQVISNSLVATTVIVTAAPPVLPQVNLPPSASTDQ